LKTEDNIYRQLQRHLDRQPVGFPRTWSGADIRLLKRLFTPEQAGLALSLSYKPSSLSEVGARVQGEPSPERIGKLLDEMFMKGAIAQKERDGENAWCLIPLVVGMFEAQIGNMTRRFVVDVLAYMRTLSFGRSMLAAQPSQMRTIPINKSIPVEPSVGTYDQIRELVDACNGPFVVLPCICRKLQAMKRQPCKQTSREESCLAFGETAAMCLRRGTGREITRDESVAILAESENEGLVLQPSNTQQAEFVCSCCGCCCGMLGMQKMLPRPVDFWASNFYAEVDADACVGCGKCVERCQVNAVTLSESGGSAVVNLNRCIGCGLCVPTCPPKALRLVKKQQEAIPPADEADLQDKIMANKKGAVGQFGMLLKVALRNGRESAIAKVRAATRATRRR